MKNALRAALRFFGAGFFGCLGAWVASSLAVILLIAVLVPVVGPFIQSLAQGLQGLPALLLGGLPGGLPEGAPGGPPAQPLPPGELPQVEIWLTKEERADAERFTSFSTQDDVFVWVRGPEGRSDQFQLAVTFAGANRMPVGPPFALDPSGAPVHCGNINPEHDPPPSPLLLEVLIGGTPAGSLEFSFEEG
jgi:hypothetical protein